MVDVKKEAKSAGEKVILVGVATAATALINWIVSRPIKRAIARRRAKVAQDREDG